jgi:murein DD-endopeptidase MepM/ murein hydrolase activator NlpD
MPRHAQRSTAPFLQTFEVIVRSLAVTVALAGLLVAAISVRGAARASAHAVAPVAKRTTPATKQAYRRRAVPQHASRSHRRTGWVRPVRGPVTSGYGPRWGGFHPGIDIGARYGAKVHAIVGGKVVSAGWIPGYGEVVRIRSHGMLFYYPHLSRIRAQRGETVDTAQVVGLVGCTGFCTGPHLHIEIRRHGHPVNPGPILRRHHVRL